MKKNIFFDKTALKVANLASKTNYDREIEFVCVTDKKIVATDSFKLIEIDLPENVGDFPDLNGTVLVEYKEKPVLLNAAQLVKMKLVKKNKRTPYLDNAVLAVRGDKYEVISKNINGTNIVQVDIHTGQYPDYNAVFPTSEVKASVILDGKGLADMASILSEISHIGRIELRFYGDGKPFEMRATDTDRKGRAIIMPIIK